MIILPVIFGFVSLEDHLSLAFGVHIVWFFFNNRRSEEVGRRQLILLGKGITQVVDNKVVGDTGFEPVTSTVCKKYKKKGKRKL
jgi:hypothetical protein